MDPGSIILIDLFRGLRIVTNGVTGGQGGDTTSIVLPDVPQLRRLFPRLAGVRLHALTEGVASSIVTWNVAFSSGYNRDNEISGGPFNLAASAISAFGTTRAAENTTDTNWSLETRLVLNFANFNAITGVNTARISATLACRLAT